jgi:LytS/YehU family sensor histidine kinase
MILQPYIENAIWHGLSHKKDGDRKITIRVQHDPTGVKYEIEDNGVGRERAQQLKSAYRKEHRSKGMELLTRRFKLINAEYQSHIETKVEDIEHNQIAAGTRVAIMVPWELIKYVKQTA